MTGGPARFECGAWSCNLAAGFRKLSLRAALAHLERDTIRDTRVMVENLKLGDLRTPVSRTKLIDRGWQTRNSSCAGVMTGRRRFRLLLLLLLLLLLPLCPPSNAIVHG
jgi:hypothetical protein